MTKARMQELIDAGLSLEKCALRNLTKGKSCIRYNNGCDGCRYYFVEMARQTEEYRSKLKRQDITQEKMAYFKELHEKAINTDCWGRSDCIHFCPLYGFICDENNPDKTSCLEKGFEIALENERRKK